MSHVVSIKTEVKSMEAIQAACKRVGAQFLGVGSHAVFSRNLSGLGVHLSGWRYPVVIDTKTGGVDFDNYHEKWGAQSVLNNFLQAYSCEVVKLQARKAGQSVSEAVQADGSILLTVQA